MKLPAYSRCSSCQAPIVWCTTYATGARMPLDPDPVIGGNVRVLDLHRDPPLVKVTGAAIDLFDEQDDGTRYVSHFVSCPNADEHRRKRT